jgi:adenylosuccinate lyase
MRRHGLEEPYEQLKAATRGRHLDATLYREILDQLALPAAAKADLERLRPADYVGLAVRLARQQD